MQFGLAPAYVLDEIQSYEINALMKNSHYRSKENWEQARLIAFMQAQTHSSKKMKLEDIIKFSWENDNNSEHNTEISNEEIARLQAQAEELERMMMMQQ